MDEQVMQATQAGAELPPARSGPITRAMLAQYAGASGDYNPIHVDSDYARAAGVPDVFAHGMLSFGILARYISNRFGGDRLRHLSARFLSVTQVHDVITCTGSVVERIEHDGEDCLRLILEVRAQGGRQTLGGEAIVSVRVSADLRPSLKSDERKKPSP